MCCVQLLTGRGGKGTKIRPLAAHTATFTNLFHLRVTYTFLTFSNNNATFPCLHTLPYSSSHSSGTLQSILFCSPHLPVPNPSPILHASPSNALYLPQHYYHALHSTILPFYFSYYPPATKLSHFSF